MKKAYSVLLASLLVFSAQASGVDNGVYFNIDTSVWSGDGYYAEKVAYVCNRDIQYTYLESGAGLSYCSERVTVALVYKEKSENDGADEYSLTFNREVKMDDNSATWCNEGLAAIFDVIRNSAGSHAYERDECKEPPESSGDSSDSSDSSGGVLRNS